MLEPTAHLDSVNSVARKLGVSTRHTIAQATALVENLVVHALSPACVSRALQRVAEAALAFGSPVSFEVPDTVWVDVSGTLRLFGGERELALTLAAHVRALGHSVRVASAAGPWLAQSFARHADFDESGVCLVDAEHTRKKSGLLPIQSLPISREAVAWFARLGLLSLDDLRRLPRASLAARLEARGFERTLELIDGCDDGVLAAYLPEELPFEEQNWEFPLESIEPLLFLIKGLSARLGARLEGRGQAAQELLLSIRYDKALAALRHRERAQLEVQRQQSSLPKPSSPGRSLQLSLPQPAPPESVGFPESLEITIRLASPLSHAEDLERILRSRLQRQSLFAPASGLRLQVTAITEARQWQQSLEVDTGLGSMLSNDPRALAVLIAELSADVGERAVGLLEAHDSHLLEKSSRFVNIQQLAAKGHAPASKRAPASTRMSPPSAAPRRTGSSRADANSMFSALDGAGEGSGSASIRQPTRLLSPVEFKAPLKEKEIVVLDQRAFVIDSIRFEERIEAVEWWVSAPISRDYFRLWLSSLSSSASAGAHAAHRVRGATNLERIRGGSDGLEVLVYLNRDDGKKYVQALYD